MIMQENNRLDMILDELRVHKVVYVSKLASKYFVSECTLRRDLAILEQKGYVHRIHGGAALIEYTSDEIPFIIRSNEFQREKDIIGSLASLLVKNGQFLLFDQSTTAAHIFPYLRDKKNLSILTNSPRAALECSETLRAQVYCTGGKMNAYSLGFTGEIAADNLRDFRPDILFFAVRAISLTDGVCEVSEENVFVKKQMMKVCRKKVLLCDSRKFYRNSYRIVCPLEDLDALITEKRPPDEWVKRLDEAGVELIYPEE